MRTAPGTRDANGYFVRVRVERRCRVIPGLRFREDAGRGHEHAVASAWAPHYASSGTPTSRIGVATMIAASQLFSPHGFGRRAGRIGAVAAIIVATPSLLVGVPLLA